MTFDVKAKTRIYDANALYHGISIDDMMDKAGSGIAEELIKQYGTDKKYSIICGLGNNGGDGLAAAYYLAQEKVKEIEVYLIGRNQDIKSQASQKFWKKLKDLKLSNLKLKQDSFAKDIDSTEVLVECLLGTGIEGRLRKRFGDVIKKISKMNSQKVVIDIPTPGYTHDFAISLHFQKVKEAKVVDIGIPPEIENFIGPGEINELHKPGKDDYKTKTGELFIFGGSPRFHGAPLMSVLAASKFVGSVYFYTTPGNRKLVDKIKSEVYEFITVADNEIEKYAGYADAFLIGPGLEDNLINRSIINELFRLFPEKKKVIDAYAIAMAPHDKLQNCVITPHRGELRHIWKDQTEYRTKRLESNLRRFSIQNEVISVLKGNIDMIFNKNGDIKLNNTGNPGMAKGGTGDVMGGMIAALACKNDLWHAAMAGTFINGMAGDLAYQEFGYNYSSTDIVPYLQKVPKWAEQFR